MVNAAAIASLAVVLVALAALSISVLSPAYTGFSIWDDVLNGLFGIFTGKPFAECSDHIDNDGNGYCDHATRAGYCSDGSIVGDPNCDSRKGTETGPCTPSKEACNGIDDDCDGQIDESLTDSRQCGYGNGTCVKGTETRECQQGAWGAWGPCTGAVYPKREMCNNRKDDDCDGQVDEGCGQ